MSTTMYRDILVPLDLDDPASWARAFPVASALHGCFGATIHAATVVPDLRSMMELQIAPLRFDEIVDGARSRLEALAASVDGAGAIACHVGIGSIYGGILDIARRIDADLILLAAHRPAMKDYLLGTNAARVVRHADCSVLVARARHLRVFPDGAAA